MRPLKRPHSLHPRDVYARYITPHTSIGCGILIVTSLDICWSGDYLPIAHWVGNSFSLVTRSRE